VSDHHTTGPEPPPAGPLDELASAILDGEATDAELARAGEPDVARRVARFSALADQVRQVPDAPAERREAAIAAALGAFDAAADRPDELAARRERRSSWADPARRLRLVGAAAAAVVAIAVGAAVLGTSPGDDETTAADAVDGGGGTSDATAESDLGATAPSSRGPDANEEQAAGSAGDASQPSAAPFDLGEFDSAEQLLDEAMTRPATGADDTAFGTTSSQGLPRCTDPTGGATRIDTAELDGRAVLVFVRADGGDDDGPEIAVVDATTCDVLAERGR
jgi:hypothetical protein